MTAVQDLTVNFPFTVEASVITGDEAARSTADQVNTAKVNERSVLSILDNLAENSFHHAIGENFTELFNC